MREPAHRASISGDINADALNARKNAPSKASLAFNLLYSMVPLLGFWLVEKYWGLQAGVVAAIGLALLEVIWVYIQEKRLEPFALCSAILVLIMGIISWQMNSTIILRLKPAIFEGTFALIFVVSTIIKKPFMLIIARKQFKDMEVNPIQLLYLRGVNFRIGILFFIHTLVTIYAALYLSMDWWALVKGVLFYVFFALFFIAEFIYSRMFFRKKMEQINRQMAFLEYQRNIIQKVKENR